MLPRSFDLSMNIATFRRELMERLDEKTRTSSPAELLRHRSRLCPSILSYFREQKAASDLTQRPRAGDRGYIDMSGTTTHLPLPLRAAVNDALSPRTRS
jgi:ATP-dependent Lhr-like helicase